MKRSILLLLAIVALVVTLVGCGSSAVKPTGDSDHARDCWAHPDASGSRHCAS